jgi:hypothetical protein
MSELTDAFSELLDSKAEVIGKREYVLLDGRKVEALVSEIRAGDLIVGGGIAQSDGFECQIAQGAVAGKPDKDTPIECRNQSLVVMDAHDVNGVTWIVTTGDPSSEDT